MNTYRPTANCQDVYSERASEAGIVFHSSAMEGNLAGLLRNNTVIVSEEVVAAPIAAQRPERLPVARMAEGTAKRVVLVK